MKKIILNFAAIFIATQVFSQSPTYFNVSISDSSTISVMNLRNSDISLDSIYNSDTILTSHSNGEHMTLVYDLERMEGCIITGDISLCDNIISYEFLSDSVVHIVMDELNVKYPAEDNVRIKTHRYIDFKNKITTYKWTWDIDNIKSHRAVVTNNVFANIQNN